MADEEVVVEEVVVEAAPTMERTDLNAVAHEVLAGQWGRGHRRTQRLKEAGLDPVAVQKEVDKILNQ